MRMQFIAVELGVRCCSYLLHSQVRCNFDNCRSTSTTEFQSIFRNQVIDCSWGSPDVHSKAPRLHELLLLCHGIKSWCDLDDKNLAVICCPSGSPAAGILVACLLKYIGAFDLSTVAYNFYCSKRCTYLFFVRPST